MFSLFVFTQVNWLIHCTCSHNIGVQEGWLSPTERASVSAISLRHIIWLPQESHAGMSFGGWHLTTSREPKAHFSLPWVRPGDNNRGKCYSDRKRIQCLSKASQHVPICLNRFPVIQAVSLKVRHFSTFFAHFGLPWGLGTPLGQSR